MAGTLPPLGVDLNGYINPVATVDLVLPSLAGRNPPLNMTMSGGVVVSGAFTIHTHTVKLQYEMVGGVIVSGHFMENIGGHIHQTMAGGVEVSGVLQLVVHHEYNPIMQGGIEVSGAAGFSTFSPAILGTITAPLTLIDTAISVTANNGATIIASLPVLNSSLKGGTNAIAAKSPVLKSVITATVGSAGTVGAQLTLIKSADKAFVAAPCTITAALTVIKPAFIAFGGSTATIKTKLTLVAAVTNARGGSGASINTALPHINAILTAGFGASGTVSARLPRIAAALSVLAQATSQQLVMVCGLRNNALSMYTAFPFNSFCQVGTNYYAAGPNGFSQIELDQGTDDATPIQGGLSTGLLQFDEAHLKRITDAYMTLRTAGNLTLTITVDEGIPAILTMNAEQFVQLIQRRVITPKGLYGKSWKFELNNTAGCDFDFEQLGFNLAVSNRRIGGIKS